MSRGSGEPGPIKLDRHGQSLWLWVGDGRWATMDVCVRRPSLQHTPQPASPTATVEADNSPTSDHLRLHLPFRSPCRPQHAATPFVPLVMVPSLRLGDCAILAV